MTEDEEDDFNDAAFFLIEVHDDLEEPSEQLGIEMERVSLEKNFRVSSKLKRFVSMLYIFFRIRMIKSQILDLGSVRNY